METLNLSAEAVATLRFEIKGWRAKDNSRRLPAYRELAAAGLMEPVDGDYRFTHWGMQHREEILERESDRIERARHVIPDGVRLSVAARDLLRACVAGEPPDGHESNRPAYRELVRANIMMPVGTFTKGDECVFKFTYTGWERRFEFAEIACTKESA